MDHANLLQCAGRDLSVINRRSGTSARSFTRDRALYRSAVSSPRRHFDAHLHGRLALLRREGLARFPQYPAPHMTRSGSLAYYLIAWICGCFFMSLCVWTRDLFATSAGDAFSAHSVFGLIFFYFYGLVFGAAASVAGGFFQIG